jgi:hypothetical protein
VGAVAAGVSGVEEGDPDRVVQVEALAAGLLDGSGSDVGGVGGADRAVGFGKVADGGEGGSGLGVGEGIGTDRAAGDGVGLGVY